MYANLEGRSEWAYDGSEWADGVALVGGGQRAAPRIPAHTHTVIVIVWG